MKTKILILITLLSQVAWGQMKSGFVSHEARDMMAICSSHSFDQLYGDARKIIPEEYQLIYTSGELGMDNKFKVLIKEDVGVICFRGSTDDRKSWLENFYSSMIPAEGVISIKDRVFEYTFSSDTAAAVHAGYSLGLAYMHHEILNQIKGLNERGIYNIFLTGHSQGGALSLLLSTYLESITGDIISDKNQFKVYAFAHPMIGNDVFCKDYYKRFADKGMSYSIINDKDLVPKMPIEYIDGKLFDIRNLELLMKPEGFDKGLLARTLIMKSLGNVPNASFKFVSSKVDDQINKELGQIKMPTYVDGINYDHIENRLVLESFVYPDILMDSTILDNDSLMMVLERNTDGSFKDRSLYQKEPMFYQHKSYNYYVGVLKAYFREEYELLSEKYLYEDL